MSIHSYLFEGLYNLSYLAYCCSLQTKVSENLVHSGRKQLSTVFKVKLRRDFCDFCLKNRADFDGVWRTETFRACFIEFYNRSFDRLSRVSMFFLIFLFFFHSFFFSAYMVLIFCSIDLCLSSTVDYDQLTNIICSKTI